MKAATPFPPYPHNYFLEILDYFFEILAYFDYCYFRLLFKFFFDYFLRCFSEFIESVDSVVVREKGSEIDCKQTYIQPVSLSLENE